jgi:hypothetical protein
VWVSGLPGAVRDDSQESQATDHSPPSQQREDGLLLVFNAAPQPPDDLPIFWTD